LFSCKLLLFSEEEKVKEDAPVVGNAFDGGIGEGL
jgi:hypothetical protein